MARVVWKSVVTADMVKGMSADEIESLADALNDVVMEVCQEYGVE